MTKFQFRGHPNQRGLTLIMLIFGVICSLVACGKAERITLGQEIRKQNIALTINRMDVGVLPGVVWAVKVGKMENYLLNTAIKNIGTSSLFLKNVVVSHKLKGVSTGKRSMIPLIAGQQGDADAMLASLIFEEDKVDYAIAYRSGNGIPIEPGTTYTVDIPTMGRDGEATFKLTINDNKEFGPYSLTGLK